MIRINEIFGPTIQGEGIMQGSPAVFIRVQGCDMGCSWCDTSYAQDAEQGEDMTEKEIADRVHDLIHFSCTKNVIITGGEPGLQDLTDLICELQERDYSVDVETSGAYWQEWFKLCDIVTVSPKLHVSKKDIDPMFEETSLVYKFVVFNEEDAEQVRDHVDRLNITAEAILQIGTHENDEDLDILNRYKKILEYILPKPEFGFVSLVLPQMHKLIYGHKRGV